MTKGKFKSARQRRWMFANHKAAAHKWAHGIATTKADWGTAKSGHARRRRR